MGDQDTETRLFRFVYKGLVACVEQNDEKSQPFPLVRERSWPTTRLPTINIVVYDTLKSW